MMIWWNYFEMSYDAHGFPYSCHDDKIARYNVHMGLYDVTALHDLVFGGRPTPSFVMFWIYNYMTRPTTVFRYSNRCDYLNRNEQNFLRAWLL